MENDYIIRKASVIDAPAILAIYKPYILKTAITFEYTVPELLEFEDRIRNVLKKYPYIVAERTGTIVGYAYVGPFHNRAAYDWAVETSIYVDENLKHSGLGKRLYNALEDILKKQGILNVNACIAYPDSTSPKDKHLDKNSAEFHEHLGYRLVGEFHKCGYKFNRWYNMIWMEKFIGEHVVDQPAVRTFEEILPEIDFSQY